MNERRRNASQPAPPPSSASPLPYGRRRSDAESAHIKGWVALADAALGEELNQSNKDGLAGNKTSGRANVAKAFEIFFGPKRRRSTEAPCQDEILI
jgi:hypothetical protein